MEFNEAIELIGDSLDVVAIAVVVIGTIGALVKYILHLLGREAQQPVYQLTRQRLGRSILLGLEIFIAGDIIRTVAISPTFQNVGVLGFIILVRTFLSTTLQIEVEGHWPWQQGISREAPGKVPFDLKEKK